MCGRFAPEGVRENQSSEIKNPGKILPGSSKPNFRKFFLRFFSHRRGFLCFDALHALQSRGLALEPAQIIQLGAADAALTQHLNRTDRWRIHGEDALDADSEAYPAHREAC